ncbi:MAG: ArsR/SmtB family transcription factor [Bacilli bacterium]
MNHNRLASIFKVLGDEHRLTILRRLQCGEACACTLIERLDISQPTLSYHLKLLESTGLTSTHKDGVWKKHVIDETVIDELIAFLLTLKHHKDLP